MVRTGRALIALVSLALAACGPKAAEVTPQAQVKVMARGVNILTDDPFWRNQAQARFRLDHLARIKQGGFDTVRVILHGFEQMDAEHRLDPAWLAILDKLVAAALAQKLTVILDEHDYTPCGENADACKPRLMAFWRQIAEHYKDADDGVMFEILNEPYGQLTDAVWNTWLVEALAVIRQTNPNRNVVIGPTSWNSIAHLDALDLPESDRHIIVTVHYYLPMEFTHQGAWWVSYPRTGVTWGTRVERGRMKNDFALVQRWAKAHDRPILLGEFGAYEKGDMTSRAAYTAAAAREAEALGWAWTYFQFDPDFAVFDMKTDSWVMPIYEALVPKN
jgi:endoglucanase